MTITFKDYVIQSDSFGGFNLQKIVQREKHEEKDGKRIATGEYYEDLDTMGYNMKLENCINKILHDQVCNWDDKLNLKDALTVIRGLHKEIKESINLDI